MEGKTSGLETEEAYPAVRHCGRPIVDGASHGAFTFNKSAKDLNLI